MTERPPIFTGNADIPPHAAFSDTSFSLSFTPTTHPDVPQALLTRSTASSPASYRGPITAVRSTCERTANRLARLARHADARPAYPAHRLVDPTRPSAFVAALACPDAFLLDAPCGPNRLGFAVDFAQEAIACGQRLLVLASHADADHLATKFGQSGFRLALCTTTTDVSEEAAHHLERRIAERERAEECGALGAVVNAKAAELERLDAIIRVAADHDAKVEGLRRELAELRLSEATPAGGLGGFVKKLFGGAKPPVDLPARIAAIEEQLHNLVPPERVAPERRESIAIAHCDADAAFARAIARPLDVAVPTVAGLQVVVASLDAFGASKILAMESPQFDRLLVVDGEDLDEDDFLTAAARAEAWVLFGSPNTDGFFAQLWTALHASPWHRDCNRLVFRLADADITATEPLFDRPEIELRFAGETLVEVAFPGETSFAEAKRFLAAELGESKLRFPGTGAWSDLGERIACECPGLAGSESVDVGEGVWETLTAEGGEPLTARVEFCKSKWNRESAEEWLTARSLPCPRTAALPKPLVIA